MLTPIVSPRSEQNTRSENQDAFGHFVTPWGDLYVVADGMGGHKGGRQAAETTVRCFQETVVSAHAAGRSPGEALTEAAARAHAAVRAEQARQNLGHNGMGSTVVAALHAAEGMVIGHAGDSRAYLIRNGKILRLTKDHSVVQQLVDGGVLTDEEARRHPDASRITAAVGIHEQVGFELQPHPVPVLEGDAFLLCSDGLCGYADDDDILARIEANTDPRLMADELVSLAQKRESDDNITVLYLQFGARRSANGAGAGAAAGADGASGAPAPRAPAPSSSAARSFVNGLLTGVVLVALLLLGLFFVLRWRDKHKSEPKKVTPPAREAPAQKPPSLKRRDANPASAEPSGQEPPAVEPPAAEPPAAESTAAEAADGEPPPEGEPR